MKKVIALLIVLLICVLFYSMQKKNYESSSILSYELVDENGNQTFIDKLFDLNDYYVEVYCDNSVSGNWNYETNSLKLNNLKNNRSKCNLILRESFLATEYIYNQKVLKDDGFGNVRFVGSNPDNYVLFNNELWRIIGVFDINNGVKKEKRVKIVRNEVLATSLKFDEKESNDFSISSMKDYLNGAYFNTLTNLSKNMVDSVVWNLGGVPTFSPTTSSQLYLLERGTNTYQGNSIQWQGKIATAYPSDYTLSMNGTTSTSRITCQEYNIFELSLYPDCFYSSYLKPIMYSWTLNPSSINNSVAIFDTNGIINIAHPKNNTSLIYVNPSLYLKTDIRIGNGDGTISKPFHLLS